MYFKVTSNDLSSLYGQRFPKYAVQYKVGEFVSPIAGKLFCYHLDHFKISFPEYSRFDENTNRSKLWICECENPVKTEIYPLYVEYVNSYIEQYKITEYTTGILQSCWRRKVILADQIKLVRQVTLAEVKRIYEETYVSSSN